MKVYYDIIEPSSYGEVDALYRLLERKSKSVTYKEVAEWLAKQHTYTLHKLVKHRFIRRKTYSRGIDYL